MQAESKEQTSSRYRPKNGRHNTRDVFERHVRRTMRSRPDSWIRKNQPTPGVHRVKCTQVYDRNEKGIPEVIEDQSRFIAISEALYWLAGEYLINGWRFGLEGIGYMVATQKPVKNPLINWYATKQYCQANGLKAGKDTYIYYTDDDYCTIAWNKNTHVKNIGLYKYQTTNYSRYGTGIRQRFTAALTRNPTLRLHYIKKGL